MKTLEEWEELYKTPEQRQAITDVNHMRARDKGKLTYSNFYDVKACVMPIKPGSPYYTIWEFLLGSEYHDKDDILKALQKEYPTEDMNKLRLKLGQMREAGVAEYKGNIPDAKWKAFPFNNLRYEVQEGQRKCKNRIRDEQEKAKKEIQKARFNLPKKEKVFPEDPFREKRENDQAKTISKIPTIEECVKEHTAVAWDEFVENQLDPIENALDALVVLKDYIVKLENDKKELQAQTEVSQKQVEVLTKDLDTIKRIFKDG